MVDETRRLVGRPKPCRTLLRTISQHVLSYHKLRSAHAIGQYIGVSHHQLWVTGERAPGGDCTCTPIWQFLFTHLFLLFITHLLLIYAFISINSGQW